MAKPTNIKSGRKKAKVKVPTQPSTPEVVQGPAIYASQEALVKVQERLIEAEEVVKKVQQQNHELELRILVITELLRTHIRCHNTGGSIIDQPAKRKLDVLDELNLRYGGEVQKALLKLGLEA